MPPPPKVAHQKPSTCSGCSLASRGHGFVPPEGPENAPIVWWGEAPGYDEAALGRPFCLVPETRVLMADLTWKSLGEIQPGDTLLAPDEFGAQTGRGASGASNRRWRIATVLNVYRRSAACEAVETRDGRLVGTRDHKLLVSGRRKRWIEIGKLQTERGRRGYKPRGNRASKLNFLFAPWGMPTSYHQGYLAGFFDGEGSISKNGRGLVVGATQNVGPLSEHVERVLAAVGYTWGVQNEQRNAGVVCRHYRLHGGSTKQFQFLGSIRPARLLRNYLYAIQERPPAVMAEDSPVLTRTPVGMREVIDIQTTTGTFIAEGFIVHNCGAAGSMLERIFRRNRVPRSLFRIANTLQCVPPGMLLEKQPYQHTAIAHCETHRQKIHREPHQVYIAAGATPLKTLLNLHGAKRIRVEEFHGTVHWQEELQRWIVPTFHPSYLQRGATNLLGVLSFDLQTALEVAHGKWTPQPIEKIIDPDPFWWDAWVDQVCAAAAQDPMGVGIGSDLETPDKAGGKPENELGPDDASYQIDRWNFSVHPDQGVTVPNHERYQAGVRRILALRCPHYWWNGSGYDWDRVFAAGFEMDRLSQYDLMLGAHILQSDIPLSLGFWAPFYSRYGAWKHLSVIPGMTEEYACIDGPQTLRVGYGIIGDLIEQGQWRAFQEDCHELLHQVLKPAQTIGVKIDRPELERFHADLEVKQRRLLHEIQACVPDSLRPLTHETAKPPQEGVLHPEARTESLRGVPLKDVAPAVKRDLYALTAKRIAREVEREILVCQTCGASEIQKRHRCKDEKGRPRHDVEPVVLPETRTVVRYFWQEPFNPDSPQQMLAYLAWKKHEPGKDKKTKEPSVNRETLERLARTTKDPFYGFNLQYRAVKKVDSTYAAPTLKRIEQDPDERIHPIPTFRPSTMRLSYVSPNITNVVGDKGGKENLAAGFRRCVVAAPGCTLAEFDFSGIEAVETGWYARAPDYVRLARLGIHAYLASYLLGRPADLSWSDAELLAYFAELKKKEPVTYDAAKRNVHGTNFGMTPYAMAAMFPHLYKDLKAAERVQGMYFEICPEVPIWHKALRTYAYDQGQLGGAGDVFMAESVEIYREYLKAPAKYEGERWWPHPFQYKHHFWSVLAYKKITHAQYLRRQKMKKQVADINGTLFGVDLGEDSKRVIAFYPQSTAAGVLKRSMRALFCRPDHPSYIGDAYFGRTPLRAPIHDSLLLEIPNGELDRVIECVAREMLRPVEEQPLPASWNMGTHLAIGVEAKAGKNWKDVEKIQIPTFEEVMLPSLAEETYFPETEEDEEEIADLGEEVA